MYLQRIELQGFKSFANKTVLEFPAPKVLTAIHADGRKGKKHRCGITSIVGPNGSGKSNVVDAVRWVLGEQSLKLLRGKKSTDIIFSGSAKKSQMGLAEVSLYLNNEDKSAPIDYSEIVITRKIFRDGSSEYFLNKNEVRLFDIVMLLAKANFGQNTYSIIGQGMVDKIVNYSGQERKNFFDEATGVKQYQIKRDKSVNKLKKSREHVAQVETLVQELEPRLKSLTRQVERLKRRQAIETELKEWQVNYYSALWFQFEESYQKFDSAYKGQEKRRTQLESEISVLQKKLESQSEEKGRSEEFDLLQQQHAELITQKNEILKELTIIKGKTDLEYSKIGKQNLSWLEDKKIELELKTKALNEESKSLALKLEYRIKDTEALQQEINKINDELAVLQNNLQIAQDDFYRQKSGQKSNYSLESVKAVLAQKEMIGGIYGTISELGKIDKKYETALAVTAGNRLWAVVVESDEVAVRCINYLKENRLSPVTFMPLNKLSDSYVSSQAMEIIGQRGVVGLAVDLIEFNDRYLKAFAQVFGNTIIVETLEDAKSIGIGRERMVTLDGDVLEKTGVMKGGFKARGSQVWAVLGIEKQANWEDRIKEVNQLKNRTDEKYRQREVILSKISELRFQTQIDQSRIDSLKTDSLINEREINKIKQEIKEAQIDPKDQDQFLKELNIKKDKLQVESDKLEKAIEEVKIKIDKFNLAEENKKREIFKTQQEMHLRQISFNEVVADLNEVKIQLAKIETKKEDLFNDIKNELGEDYKIKPSKAESEFDFSEAEAKIVKFKKQLELIGGTDPEIEKEYNEVKTRFEFLAQQNADLTKAINDLERVVIELDKLIKKQFEEEFKKINQDFSRYFKQLFDGGSARLVLSQKEVTEAEIAKEEVSEVLAENGEAVEDENGIEAKAEKKHVEDKLFLSDMGIEIEACPPGKKIKNIAVLSGGEKTMTALGLICAIISNNPSPFILFDEVDAALDENNSEKFGKILEELSNKTQFIVITHNRAIMANADVLYGVTMQGDGVSRLIGLKFEEAEKMTN